MDNDFLHGQGYVIMNNMVYQYNQNSIRMKTTGRNYRNGNSIHINTRYFFVKDRVDQGEVKIEYCPTKMMLAVFLENRSRERFSKYSGTS